MCESLLIMIKNYFDIYIKIVLFLILFVVVENVIGIVFFNLNLEQEIEYKEFNYFFQVVSAVNGEFGSRIREFLVFCVIFRVLLFLLIIVMCGLEV